MDEYIEEMQKAMDKIIDEANAKLEKLQEKVRINTELTDKILSEAKEWKASHQSDIIAFAMYVTGHGEATCQQMYADYCRSSLAEK